ncbi:sensor protein CzcS precursor [bacterium BMS3Abin03]|nr:sensor protein CzcS precursor [bacterium BMS3Abin03]
MSFLPKNVRTRLTLWYVLALTFILIIYASVSISLVYINLRNNLDDQLQQDYEIVENLMRVMPDGSVKIESEDDPYFHERWFQIWSSDWKMLYESSPFTGKSLPSISREEESTSGFHFQSMQLNNNVRVRILSGKINIEGKWLFIRLVRSEERLWNELSGFIRLMLIALPIAIFIAGFGGYFLTKKFLSPIDEMTAKVRKIGEENLKERLPVINPDDELGNLAHVFNDMLERIQKSFERLKRFTSDAAHELRTPLTAIRSIGEVGLQDYKDAKHYREIIGSMLEENRRLTHLVDNLLFLSRADAKTLDKHLIKLELKSFTQETVEFIQALAEEKNQIIIIRAEKEITVIADRALLKQALLNLLDNAIKYSPENSEIIVSVDTEHNNAAFIEVKDNGPGIPEEHHEKIFERFYRVDKGRSREMGGSGLGLAIARWAVTAQGGKLTMESKTGEGSSFRITLTLT